MGDRSRSRLMPDEWSVWATNAQIRNLSGEPPANSRAKDTEARAQRRKRARVTVVRDASPRES